MVEAVELEINLTPRVKLVAAGTAPKLLILKTVEEVLSTWMPLPSAEVAVVAKVV
jgi:hypothetical protein